MSNPVGFINAYTRNIMTMMDMLKELRLQNDMIVTDPTLIDRYFSQPAGTIVRTDITKQDVLDAKDAVVQMLFTLDSGSPTTASKLYHMYNSI